jgi:ribosomal protein L37AE/L43A
MTVPRLYRLTSTMTPEATCVPCGAEMRCDTESGLWWCLCGNRSAGSSFAPVTTPVPGPLALRRNEAGDHVVTIEGADLFGLIDDGTEDDPTVVVWREDGDAAYAVALADLGHRPLVRPAKTDDGAVPCVNCGSAIERGVLDDHLWSHVEHGAVECLLAEPFGPFAEPPRPGPPTSVG